MGFEMGSAHKGKFPALWSHYARAGGLPEGGGHRGVEQCDRRDCLPQRCLSRTNRVNTRRMRVGGSVPVCSRNGRPQTPEVNLSAVNIHYFGSKAKAL